MTSRRRGYHGRRDRSVRLGVLESDARTFTAVRDVTPSRRTDRSYQAGYTWSRPSGNAHVSHRRVVSGLAQRQRVGSECARQLYVHRALHRERREDRARQRPGLGRLSSWSAAAGHAQYSVTPDNITQSVALTGRQFSTFVQDDWRWKARWTINYGLQYDVLFPYTERNGHLVNLDANSAFHVRAPWQRGRRARSAARIRGSGEHGLEQPGAAGLGLAWRVEQSSVVRPDTGLSYNAGSYSTIARQLSQQPPFFQTGTSLGTLESPLVITSAFSGLAPGHRHQQLRHRRELCPRPDSPGDVRLQPRPLPLMERRCHLHWHARPPSRPPARAPTAALTACGFPTSSRSTGSRRRARPT
jgi:hypothetical protein